MKVNCLLINGLFVVLLTLSFSCKDDDDGGMGNNEPVDFFTTTCCEVPHLEGCVGGAEIFVPNTFTPNADGVNDIFYVFGGDGIKEIASFKILDGGTIVFEDFSFYVNDPQHGWDGTFPDGSIGEGIFDYELSVSNVADETIAFEGKVCCRPGFSNPCVDLEKHCAYGTQYDGNGGFDPTRPTFEECE